jgi:lysozyme
MNTQKQPIGKQTSVDGLNLIKQFEGLRLKAYLCPAKIASIGLGNTFYEDGRKVRLTDAPITEKRADELLLLILKDFEKYVNSYVQTNIDQHQFDALTSFCYNVGPYNFKSSTLLKKVNKNPDDSTIYSEFLKWDKTDGSHDGIDNDGDGLIDEPGEKKPSGLWEKN